MIKVDGNTMRAIAPRFAGAAGRRQNEIINAVGDTLAQTLHNYQIDTRLRIAHFLGQVCHESAGFRTTEEFASGADYEGRRDLGNTVAGDGVRYKGRGLLQLTGRANYKRLGAVLNLQLEQNPEIAGDPAISLLIACEYWKDRNINRLCDQDDVVAVTRAVNGGTNGLQDRRELTARAMAVLGGDGSLPDFSDVQGGTA